MNEKRFMEIIDDFPSTTSDLSIDELRKLRNYCAGEVILWIFGLIFSLALTALFVSCIAYIVALLLAILYGAASLASAFFVFTYAYYFFEASRAIKRRPLGSSRP